MTETRCFIGFELAEESRVYLRDLLEPVQGLLAAEFPLRMRLVLPENWHATLLFFPGLSAGERGDVWAEIERGVVAGTWRGVQFDWRGLALWPSAKRPNLLCLVASVYPGAGRWPLFQKLDVPPFERADLRHVARFQPHITMMRAASKRRVDARAAWHAIESDIPLVDPRRVRFDRVAFFLSTLSREQPVYVRERSLSLD